MFSNRKLILWIVLLMAICITAYVLLVIIPKKVAEQSYNGAKQIGKDISEALQFTPEITVNNTVVLQQQTSLLELATLSQSFKHEVIWKNTWLSSTKSINITGTFQAKAGFDIHKKMQIVIEDKTAIVTLPPPQLLSIEPKGDYTFRDEDGIWNWVNEEDRAVALNSFTKDAKQFAQQATFIEDSKKALEEKMRPIFEAHGYAVTFQYMDTIPKE